MSTQSLVAMSDFSSGEFSDSTYSGSDVEGLTVEEIRGIPEVNIAPNSDLAQQECSICLEHFMAGENVKRLPCDHHFHGPCVSSWLQIRANCPVCRAGVVGVSNSTDDEDEDDDDDIVEIDDSDGFNIELGDSDGSTIEIDDSDVPNIEIVTDFTVQYVLSEVEESTAHQESNITLFSEEDEPMEVETDSSGSIPQELSSIAVSFVEVDDQSLTSSDDDL